MEVQIWYLKSAALPKWNWEKKKNSEKKWNLNKVAAPVLSDPVTARLLTRLGADCLQNKIFLLSLVSEAKDEERHQRKGSMSQYYCTWQESHLEDWFDGWPGCWVASRHQGRTVPGSHKVILERTRSTRRPEHWWQDGWQHEKPKPNPNPNSVNNQIQLVGRAKEYLFTWLPLLHRRLRIQRREFPSHSVPLFASGSPGTPSFLRRWWCHPAICVNCAKFFKRLSLTFSIRGTSLSMKASTAAPALTRIITRLGRFSFPTISSKEWAPTTFVPFA